MNNLLKRLIKILIITLITIFLLEMTSYSIFSFYYGCISHEKYLSIFKQTCKSGKIEVNEFSVLPVKENANINWITDDFNVMVSTNNIGLREKFNINNDEVDIAFFGDSFTFGHGVNNDERYSYIFSQDSFFSGYKVVNFSYINGFQPEHYEYYLRNNIDLRPKYVIIGLCLENDLGSDIDETNYNFKTNSLSIPYRLISSNGLLINNPVVYRIPINYLIDISSFVKLTVSVINRTTFRKYLFDPNIKVHPNQPNRVDLELGNEDLMKNRGILSLIRIKKLLEGRGGELTVLLIPPKYFFTSDTADTIINNELSNKIIKIGTGNNILKTTIDVLDSVQIDYYNPLESLNIQSYFKIDAHWNSEGHLIVGNELAKYIKEKL
ncbi:SGNH/GDSL hydrolase family protein [Candidatus Neomarinimicrobiota bacterium]